MLLISEADIDFLRQHAEQAYPRECCGVLLGMREDEVRTVRQVLACQNLEPALNRYRIDPRELIRIQRQARGAGLEIIGFYHSHPEQPAQWSRTDLEEALWLGCSYVIVSMNQGRVGEIRSFVLNGNLARKSFEAEQIASGNHRSRH